MPGYNVHRLFNYAIFIAIIILVYAWNISIINLKNFLAFGAGYYTGTVLLTPDMDTESTAIKKWGKLKILVLPYMWLFVHRKSSHNIVYGAVVRILYIGIIILVGYYLLFKSLPVETIFSSVYVFIFLIGIIIANALHILLDALL
ncbi:MAG: DUF2227 family putative metal-binding protein [Candidatus Methanoperedens sp.]